MESGAKGCEVIVSGKLRAQRAKAMKFKDGYMIAAGHPAEDYIVGCVRWASRWVAEASFVLFGVPKWTATNPAAFA